MRSVTKCLLFSALAVTAQHSVYAVTVPQPEFSVIKFNLYLQESASTPQLASRLLNPFEFEVSVSNNIPAGSAYDGVQFTLPGTSTTIPLTFNAMDDEYSHRVSDTTQSAIDSQFPNGDYLIEFTSGGAPLFDAQSNVTLNLNGDDDGEFPSAIPQLISVNGQTPIFTPDGINGASFIEVDPAQDTTFMWNSPGFTLNDNLLGIFAEDFSSGNSLLENLLTTDETGITIPAGTFSENQYIEFGLSFINKTDEGLLGTDDSSGASGFINETFFYVQVIPEPQTYALLGLGIGMLFMYYRKRQKQAS